MTEELAENATAAEPQKPAAQFCDRDGARHQSVKNDKDEVVEGHPVGCGALLPEGSYSDSWIELADPDDETSPRVRKHGRFFMGDYKCSKCGTIYHSSIAERMKATAAAS